MANSEQSPITSNDESHERDLNRHRGAEERNARAEVAARLADRGVTIDENDSDEAVVELWEAIEAFEQSVEAQGGDLMIDTPPAQQPDDPRFVMPRREGTESLGGLTARVRAATDRLRTSRTD